jgi:hypothetical protein
VPASELLRLRCRGETFRAVSHPFQMSGQGQVWRDKAGINRTLPLLSDAWSESERV